MTTQNRGRVFIGIFLVGLGLLLLVTQFLGGYGDIVFLVAIGTAFVAGYFYRRAYGLLVPGCLLLGLGASQIIERVWLRSADLSLLGLGGGFVAIYLIDLVYRRASHWWPLIPGGILVAIGLANSNPSFQYWLSVGWPVILILIGILMLAGALGLRYSFK